MSTYFRKYICTYTYDNIISKNHNHKIHSLINSIEEKDFIEIIKEINKLDVYETRQIMSMFLSFTSEYKIKSIATLDISLFILSLSYTFMDKYKEVLSTIMKLRYQLLNDYTYERKIIINNFISNSRHYILEYTNSEYIVSIDNIFKLNESYEPNKIQREGFEFLFNNFYENENKIKKVLKINDNSIYKVYKCAKNKNCEKISNIFKIKYTIFCNFVTR